MKLDHNRGSLHQTVKSLYQMSMPSFSFTPQQILYHLPDWSCMWNRFKWFQWFTWFMWHRFTNSLAGMIFRESQLHFLESLLPLSSLRSQNPLDEKVPPLWRSPQMGFEKEARRADACNQGNAIKVLQLTWYLVYLSFLSSPSSLKACREGEIWKLYIHLSIT